MNVDTGLYDVTEINKLIQGISGSMSIAKKGKLNMMVCQIHGSEKLHILWPMKYCERADTTFFPYI